MALSKDQRKHAIHRLDIIQMNLCSKVRETFKNDEHQKLQSLKLVLNIAESIERKILHDESVDSDEILNLLTSFIQQVDAAIKEAVNNPS